MPRTSKLTLNRLNLTLITAALTAAACDQDGGLKVKRVKSLTVQNLRV